MEMMIWPWADGSGAFLASVIINFFKAAISVQKIGEEKLEAVGKCLYEEKKYLSQGIVKPSRE